MSPSTLSTSPHSYATFLSVVPHEVRLIKQTLELRVGPLGEGAVETGRECCARVRFVSGSSVVVTRIFRASYYRGIPH